MSGPTTVGGLEARLRGMLGHAGKRERQTILDAIEAIHELATRLEKANEIIRVGTLGTVAERRPRLTL